MISFRDDMTVRLVQSAGSDTSIAKAARVSTVGAGSTNWNNPVADAGLINFLMRERHGSPFEHNSMTFLIEAPIFVVREFMRHRAGWSYNEESGRYKQLQPVFYMPSTERPLVQVGKPGAYTFEPGRQDQHTTMRAQIRLACQQSYNAYEKMLNAGIAREVARMVLPVNIYSSMYVTCNTRSLMHFLSLRTKRENTVYPSGALEEIDMVATQIEEYAVKLFPTAFSCFDKHGRVAP